MNRFFILALIATLCSGGALYAQDIIVLKNGGELKVTDIRITETEVLFRMYDFPPGETVSKVARSRISMIKYRDGRREAFNEQQDLARQYGNQQQYVTQQPSESQRQYGTQQQYESQQENRYQQQYEDPQPYENQQENRYQRQYGNQQQYENPQENRNPQQYGNRQQYETQKRNRKQDLYEYRQPNDNQPYEYQSYNNQPQYKYQPSGWWKFNAGFSFPKPNISFPFLPFGSEDLEFLNEIGIDLNEIFGKGYGIGLKYYHSLGTTLPYFSLVGGVELYYHGLNSDTKEKMEKNYYGNEADVTYPLYFNLPVTIGGNFTAQLPNTNASIYGEASAGVNVSYITKTALEMSDEYDNIKLEVSYEPAFAFCYGFEAGFVLNNKVYIGVRHNNLGTYKYKWKGTYTGTYRNYDGKTHTETETVTGKNKLELKNTVLVLGIKF